MTFFKKLNNSTKAFSNRSALSGNEAAYIFNMKNGNFRRADELVEKMIDNAWEIPQIEEIHVSCGILYADFAGMFKDSLEQTKGKLIQGKLFPIWWLVDTASQNLNFFNNLGQHLKECDISKYEKIKYDYTDIAINVAKEAFTSYEIPDREYMSEPRKKVAQLEQDFLKEKLFYPKIELVSNMGEVIWGDGELSSFYKKLGLNKKLYKKMLTEWMLSEENFYIESQKKFFATLVLIDDYSDHDLILQVFFSASESSDTHEEQIERDIRFGTKNLMINVKEFLVMQGKIE